MLWAPVDGSVRLDSRYDQLSCETAHLPLLRSRAGVVFLHRSRRCKSRAVDLDRPTVTAAVLGPSYVEALARATASAAAPGSVGGFVPADEAMEMLFQCGVLGRVAAYFRVPRGQRHLGSLPKMGRAPEIEDESGLFVAVYDGEVAGPFAVRAPGPHASR